jgi:hypothetical protein
VSDPVYKHLYHCSLGKLFQEHLFGVNLAQCDQLATCEAVGGASQRLVINMQDTPAVASRLVLLSPSAIAFYAQIERIAPSGVAACVMSPLLPMDTCQ